MAITYIAIHSWPGDTTKPDVLISQEVEKVFDFIRVSADSNITVYGVYGEEGARVDLMSGEELRHE